MWCLIRQYYHHTGSPGNKVLLFVTSFCFNWRDWLNLKFLPQSLIYSKTRCTRGNSMYFLLDILPKYAEFALTSTILCIKFNVFFLCCFERSPDKIRKTQKSIINNTTALTWSGKAEDTLLRLQWSNNNKIRLQRDGKQMN